MKKAKQPEKPVLECGDVWWCINRTTQTASIGARCTRPLGHKPPHAEVRRGPATYGKRSVVSIVWGWVKDEQGDTVEWTE